VGERGRERSGEAQWRSTGVECSGEAREWSAVAERGRERSGEAQEWSAVAKHGSGVQWRSAAVERGGDGAAHGQEPRPQRRIFCKQMADATEHIEQFERSLLRRSVGVLVADRHRCADCGRTPLVGERVHLYERGKGIVCELCRPLHHDHPTASELVRHFERGHTVRLAARAA
jgi:hypothetical protein